MTRWNPCCCDQVVILPEDMVLVRAGWYHFMVMTKNGKINVFTDSGVRSDGVTTSGDPSYFYINGELTRNFVGPDGKYLNGVASCWSLTDNTIKKLNSDQDLDPLGWLLTNNGDNTDDYYHPYNTTADQEGGISYFGMTTLYPESCNGFPWWPCIDEPIITEANPDPRNIRSDNCGGGLGACCGKDKICKLTTPASCNGYFQGVGTKCVDPETGNPTGICEVPGACCVAGENNKFAPVIRNAFQCVGYTLGSTADGITMIKTTFFGNNTNFSMGFSCSARIEITGACCTKDRGCVITSLEKCNGYFQGAGTTCGETGAICDVPGLCCVSDNEGNWEQLIATAKDCVGYTFTNVFLDPRLGITCSDTSAVCGFTVINKTFFGNNTDFTLNVNCSTNKFIGADLCPYYKIEGLVGSAGLLDTASGIFPHGYFEFNGAGCAIARPPNTVRQNSLILARGLSGTPGITKSVLVERYQPMATPVNSLHPLAIPENLNRRLNTGERRVIDIECGAYHNIVRLDDNSIVCWGLNSMGQCNVPDELKPDWDRPNGQIEQIETYFSSLSEEELTISLDNPFLEVKDSRGTRGGVEAKIRLNTRPIGTKHLIVGAQIVDSGYGYLQSTVSLKIPGTEANNDKIISRIQFTVKQTTVPHVKKSKICSIHAGFNNTAVLFNDGTALCWGDPEVANQINQWENIRISPIKRKPTGFDGTAKSCNGIDSQGFPDPDKPQFPANKYNNGTFNINTDWYELWRTGTPVYPHFDLGVETGNVRPVNYDSLVAASDSIPGRWCSDCNDTSKHKIIKDFAVGMLRSGQIVTTRKTNAPTSGKNRLYSRDCSIDANYVNNPGFVNPPDIGPVIVDTVITNPDTGESLNCRDIAEDVLNRTFGPGSFVKCSPYACSAYNNLALRTDADNNTIYDKPEGIGCYTSLKEGEDGVFYDPNWATGNIYTPGQQVRPQGFTGGRWPDWNRGDMSYGWETKVAVGSRNRPSSQQYLTLIGNPLCVSSDGFNVSRCVMRLGNTQPCNEFCPSDPNFKWRDPSGNSVDYFSAGKGNEGVPGYFRYPIHIATTLTCVAGTNTVNWVHSARLLPIRDTVALQYPIAPGGLIQAEKELWGQGCIKHHGDYTGCGECNYVGGNNEMHDDEIGDIRTAGIYSSNTDSSSVNNPLIEDDPIGPQQLPLTFMLPSKPWGPWQLVLLTGTATPPKLDMGVCSYTAIRVYGCAHMSIESKGELPFIGSIGGNQNFTPNWFNGYCEGSVSLLYDAFKEKIKFGKTIRHIRKAGGIFWPTSTAWQSTEERYILGNIDCSLVPECDPNSPYFIPGPNGERCGVAPFLPASNLEEGVDPGIEINCKGSKIPCNGDMPPNLFKLCYGIEDEDLQNGKRALFPPAINAPLCRGSKGTYEFCGITGCDMDDVDTCNKWCFDNPTLSYATGRSFAIFIRKSPWERGLSGEFIWQKHCSKTNADYTFTQFDSQGYSRDFEGIKGTKLWLTGSLYDPCPPWPRRCNVDENCEGLTGLTCGTYPTWVPVPDNNKITSQKDKNHYASKGYWEYESQNYVNTKKYSETNWIFQESCEKYFNLSLFANEEIKERFKISGRYLIDIFKEYIGYGEEDG